MVYRTITTHQPILLLPVYTSHCFIHMFPVEVRGRGGGYDMVVFDRHDVGLLGILLLLIALVLILLYIRLLLHY